jgi:hypothetical protein
LETFWDSLGASIDSIGDIIGTLFSPPAAWISRMRKVIEVPAFWCNLYPISLQYFRAQPAPDPIPVASPLPHFLDSSDDSPPVTNQGSNIYAAFAPIWSKDQAATALVKR